MDAVVGSDFQQGGVIGSPGLDAPLRVELSEEQVTQLRGG